MDVLKEAVTKQPYRPRVVGLSNASKEEIDDIKYFLKTKGVPFKHETKYKDGSPMPQNGILKICLTQ